MCDDELPVTKSVKPRWRGLDLPTPDVSTFFASIFDGDQELIDYMRRVLGAAITGERLEAYMCWTGVGSNGKGCLHEWMRVTLGDYYCTGSPYVFFGEKMNRGGATPELAALDRMRLAVVDESSETDMLNTALVKRLTGSDVIPVRRLYQVDFWEMAVTHTQVLLTQHLPKIDVEDEAMRRRIVVVPFRLRFKSDEEFDASDPTHRRKDPALGSFLQSEDVMEQLLVWLVGGAVDYYAAGRKLPEKPPAVREAERAYYHENDPIGQLIEEECQIGDDYRVVAADFNARASARGGKKVAAAMLRRGFVSGTLRVDGSVVRFYKGLKMT